MIRKPNILILLMVTMVISMTSCVEEFTIEDKDFESKLVVNALFDSSSPWSVEVSNSANIFDSNSEIEKITFARVEIYDQNDEFLYELLHKGDGKYGRKDYAPSPKRSYSVKVSAPGYKTVTAKSFVPEKSNLVINNYSIIPNDKYEDVEVDFEIEDNSKLESYYLWEVVRIDGEEGGGDTHSGNQMSDNWIDALTNNPNDLVNTDREFLENGSFGDGTYKGTYSSVNGNRRITFSNINLGDANFSDGHEAAVDMTNKLDPDIDDPNEVSDDTDGLEEDEEEDNEEGSGKVKFKFELRVMTISKELYNYYSSLEEYYQNNGSNHSHQAPWEAYTNVENGAGIFAGFSESYIQF